MYKKYLLVTLGLVLILGIGLVLLSRTVSSTPNILRTPISSTPATGSNLTPIGTPYTQPPEEKSTATTTQIGKIDEHLTIDNTFRDVNFCGTTYKVKKIIIDGVDAVQRIADLVTASNLDYMKGVCDRAESLRINGWLNLDKNEIGVSPITRDTNSADTVYKMSLVSPTGNFQSIGDFKIDVTTKEIVIVLQGFADSSEKTVGKLE
jgi:hypothetical protein